jgi:hypothetical protein
MFNPLGFSPTPGYPLPRQMAVESKPLFHPEVLRQQVQSFCLPEHTDAWQPKLHHWADLIRSGRADELTETTLLPDFLTDFFYGLLGYTGPAEGLDAYTLSRGKHVEVDGEFADAVLGRFHKGKEQFVAVLEGKGKHRPDEKQLTEHIDQIEYSGERLIKLRHKVYAHKDVATVLSGNRGDFLSTHEEVKQLIQQAHDIWNFYSRIWDASAWSDQSTMSADDYKRLFDYLRRGMGIA